MTMPTKILAIDDDPTVTRMIQLNLQQAGRYEVLTVNDSASALSAARQFRPDLILLDVMMPGPDGGEVAAGLESDPVLKDVPIVFLTAIVTKKETGPGGKSIRGRRFIAKPVTLEELVGCIEESLKTDGRR
jgi:CheY-like chemotaxis protein